MNDAPPPSLRARMRDGATRDDPALESSLGLVDGASETEVALALVRRLGSLRPTPSAVTFAPPEPVIAAPPPDASFLGRLGAGGRAVESLEDLKTLLAVLRGGRLVQRRGAARRLADLARAGALEPEDLEAADAELSASRDEDIAWEVLAARAALPGAAGREARDEDGAFAALVARVSDAARAFWNEDGQTEPLLALPAEDLALLALRSRDLPDALVDHVAAILEGSDGVTDVPGRARLASVFRCAADPRLVPALASLATSRSPELVRDGARALGRIEDPRVAPILARVFERAADPAARALAGGALGFCGNARALPFLRELLASDDRRLLRAAAEAISELGTDLDVPRIVRLLEDSDETLAAHAARALGQIGDARALGPLKRRASIEGSSLRGEIEDAIRAITAQMELRGEGAPADNTSAVVTAKRNALRAPDRSGLATRLVALFDLWIGRVLLATGAIERAIARFEQSAARRPTWAAPLASIGIAQVRRGRLAPALAAFRRALSADRDWVEAQISVARTVARTFLRRAEEMERAGRRDIALGLLDEVRTLDLRRVDEPLRFEIVRRADRLRAEVHA
jgi:HEAT repeat protein